MMWLRWSRFWLLLAIVMAADYGEDVGGTDVTADLLGTRRKAQGWRAG